MIDFYAILKSHIETHPPSFGDGDSVLSMLYEAFAEANPMDDGRLKQDFHELYELMNGSRSVRWTKSSTRFVPYAGTTSDPASWRECELE